MVSKNVAFSTQAQHHSNLIAPLPKQHQKAGNLHPQSSHHPSWISSIMFLRSTKYSPPTSTIRVVHHSGSVFRDLGLPFADAAPLPTAVVDTDENEVVVQPPTAAAVPLPRAAVGTVGTEGTTGISQSTEASEAAESPAETQMVKWEPEMTLATKPVTQEPSGSASATSELRLRLPPYHIFVSSTRLALMVGLPGGFQPPATDPAVLSRAGSGLCAASHLASIAQRWCVAAGGPNVSSLHLSSSPPPQ